MVGRECCCSDSEREAKDWSVSVDEWEEDCWLSVVTGEKEEEKVEEEEGLVGMREE